MKNFFPVRHKGLVLDKVRDEAMLKALQAFRHRVFREQLGWVPVCEDGLDKDGYDGFSDNLVLLQDNEVVGAIRLTPGEYRFMLEAEFSRLLVPGEEIGKGPEYAEITRLAIDRNKLTGRQSVSATYLLYLGIWLWSRMHQVDWLYFVVEPVLYRRLVMMGFPLRPVGIPMALEGGVLSMAGMLDWQQARPEFIQSLLNGVSVPNASQELWHEYDYSH